nr:MAG TPA: hypothetical protein [Caudoviricetes sp.]
MVKIALFFHMAMLYFKSHTITYLRMHSRE